MMETGYAIARLPKRFFPFFDVDVDHGTVIMASQSSAPDETVLIIYRYLGGEGLLHIPLLACSHAAGAQLQG